MLDFFVEFVRSGNETSLKDNNVKIQDYFPWIEYLETLQWTF